MNKGRVVIWQTTDWILKVAHPVAYSPEVVRSNSIWIQDSFQFIDIDKWEFAAKSLESISKSVKASNNQPKALCILPEINLMFCWQFWLSIKTQFIKRRWKQRSVAILVNFEFSFHYYETKQYAQQVYSL